MELTSKSFLTKIAVVVSALAVTLAMAGSSALAKNDDHDHDNNGSGYQGYAKDQCKHGGWKKLGFKNQGQCVSFFVHVQNGKVCTIDANQAAELDAFFKTKHFDTTINGQTVHYDRISDGKLLNRKSLMNFLRASDPHLVCSLTGKDHQFFLPVVQ